jgi:hypothetical protein
MLVISSRIVLTEIDLVGKAIRDISQMTWRRRPSSLLVSMRRTEKAEDRASTEQDKDIVLLRAQPQVQHDWKVINCVQTFHKLWLQ